MNEKLKKDVDEEEVVLALKQMHPSKAPGPDGFSAGFYRHYWDIVGQDVVKGIRCFLRSRELMAAINHTHVALIPKSASPESITQLRPISLCNVLYKLGSKVLANRLKPLMNGLISSSQSAFIPGRLITDNALLAYEVSHCINQRRKGKVGLCSMKLDMSKAYDRVEWRFIEEIMKRLGFCDEWINMIMLCISTVTYSVLVNGNPRGCIRPARGLRQGDALSPFLFLFCGEYLSRLIGQAEEENRFRGIKICKAAPSVSHLFFADDALVFCTAETMNCVTLQSVLVDYERRTGQQVNYGKSGIAFSRNVEFEEQQRLADMMGMTRVDHHSSYLGMPMELGRARTKAFDYLVEKMRRRIDGWHARLLSTAGKEVLIKSVVQAIPSYMMGCFELPQHTCDEFHRLMSNYWWGSKEASKKIHWTSWEHLCRSKSEGGLGFREMHDFNLAMLAKQGWRLIHNPTSLVARVLKAKYFPGCNFMEATRSCGMSATWRSIMAGKVVLAKGLRYQVRDGKSVGIWGDPWLPRLHRFRPFTFPVQGWEEHTVDHLLDNGSKCWNIPLLQTLFCDDDASMIARIPLGRRRDSGDVLIWHFEKRGLYTVRSGYRCQRTAMGGPSSSATSAHNPGGSMGPYWNKLWALHLPPKVRVFCWRLISNFVPLRCSLAGRHIPIGDTSCVVCGAEPEDTSHLFRDCQRVREVWSHMGLHGILKISATCAWKEWLLEVIDLRENNMLELFITSLWGIWVHRNRVIYEEWQFDAYGVSIWIKKLVTDYKQAHQHTKVGRQRIPVKWDGPPRGRLKINFDGAFDATLGCGGIGVVVRNEHGVGIAAIARPIKFALSPLCMEAEACRLGLELGRDQGWDAIDIEGDSIQLVEAISSTNIDLSEVGQVITDCRWLLSTFSSITIRHNYREANGVAHRLAHAASYKGLNNIWLDETPAIIQDVLYEDMCNMPHCNRSISISSPPDDVVFSNSINSSRRNIELH